MKSLFFVSAILFTLGAHAAKVAPPKTDGIKSYEVSAKAMNDGAYEAELSADYFQTLSHYDMNGNEITMDEGDSFTRLQSTATLRYGISSKLQIYGGLNYRQNTSETTETSVTSSGLEAYFLGTKYTFPAYGNFLFAVELRGKGTPYSNEDYTAGTATPTDELVLGDSGLEMTGLIHAAWIRTSKHSVSGYWGYNKPGNGLSPEFPWNLETAWTYPSFAFRLGVQGLTSLGSDQFKEAPESKPMQATGETYLYNSIDRSFIKPFVGINFAKGNWRLEGTLARVVAGTSTDSGNEIKLALVYSTNGTSITEKKIESFKEYGIEGTVIKVSPRSTFIKIDQGSSQDVEKGMKFDIFQTDYYGGNEMIASAVAYEVGASWTILKIVKTYKDTPIKKGFMARGH